MAPPLSRRTHRLPCGHVPLIWHTPPNMARISLIWHIPPFPRASQVALNARLDAETEKRRLLQVRMANMAGYPSQ